MSTRPGSPALSPAHSKSHVAQYGNLKHYGEKKEREEWKVRGVSIVKSIRINPHIYVFFSENERCLRKKN